MMHSLDLSDEERAIVRELLEIERRDVHSEIRRAMVPHDDLRLRLQRVESALGKLGAPAR
jgi:hypothetical protein